MNILRVTEVNTDPQLNQSTQKYADSLRPRLGNTIVSEQLVPGLNIFDHNGFTFGQTFGIDVQACSLEDGATPQPGIVDFAHELGIAQNNLLMPRLDKHTTRVLVVDSLSDVMYSAEEGRSTGYDAVDNSTYIDALIVKETPETKDMVLAITGADCPSIVGSGILVDGTHVIFGIHAGRKGCLGGIIENTAEILKDQGVLSGSVHIAIGPGGQTLELPLEVIKKEAQENQHDYTFEIWQDSIAGEHSKRATNQHMVIYDNQADVVRRAQLAFSELIAPNGYSIIDANTLTTDSLKSYRATTLAKSAGDINSEQSKLGRNALFTGFNF